MSTDDAKSKKKYPVTPLSTLAPINSAQLTEIGTDADTALLNNLLQSSIDQYQATVDKQLKVIKQDISTLENVLAEYLDDYIVIGHTLNSERVVIRYASNPKDYDALRELSREYLIRLVDDTGNLIKPDEE